MNNLFALIVISMFIEAFISYVQTIFKENRIQWQIVIAFIFAVIICFDTQLNFLQVLGIQERWPQIGTAITALVVCRGSNYLFEFYNQLTSWRKKAGDEQPPALATKKEKKKIHVIH